MGLCLASSKYEDETSSDCSEIPEKHIKQCPKPPPKSLKVNHVKQRPVQSIKRPQKRGKNANKRVGNKRQGQKKMVGDDKWAEWQASEEANRSERKVRKQIFYGVQYDFDDLRKGTIVYDERRGPYKDQLQDVEDEFENAVKKERRIRRQRKVNESLSWRLF